MLLTKRQAVKMTVSAVEELIKQAKSAGKQEIDFSQNLQVEIDLYNMILYYHERLTTAEKLAMVAFLTESLHGDSIDELDLSVRTWNALMRSGIKHISQLVTLSEVNYRTIPHLGLKGIEEVKEALARYRNENGSKNKSDSGRKQEGGVK